MMKATWEKTEDSKGILTIETSEDTVNKALSDAFKKVAQKVTVPGFRKGKVPRSIFEKRFGVESLYQDALNIMLPEVYEAAVKEANIKPVDRPDIDVEQFEKGKPCVVKATVTVEPEVTLGEYKNLEIPSKEFTVTDEQIDSELKKMQRQQGQLVSVEEGTVNQGDHAIIDFEGFLDKVPFEGGKGENYSLEIGSGSFIPGFEDQLVGMAVGEEKEIEVTFPEEYHSTDLAGKAVMFKVKVNELKQLSLPELDDEFAKDVSELETLEELRKDIEGKLQEKSKKEEDEYIRNQLTEIAAANAKVDIPAVMVEQEAEKMVQEFSQQLMYQGMNLEALFGKSKEELKEEWKENAEKSVKQRLVLKAISQAENVEASEEAVNEEITKLADQMNRAENEIRQLLEAQGAFDSIREKLVMEKTVELLVSHSKSEA